MSYYIKYLLLFFTVFVSIDTGLFFYKNDVNEIDNIKILAKAIEKNLEKGDLEIVNDVLDSFKEKIIIQRDGVMYTSNYQGEPEERRAFATAQLQTYRAFWRHVSVPNEKYNYLLYYKTREISYFDRIIQNTILSFFIALASLPFLFLFFYEIRKKEKEKERVTFYLGTLREKIELLKDKEVVQEYDNEKNDRLKKKLEESKNKRLALKQELEISHEDLNKLKNEFTKLKNEYQNFKNEKTKVEENSKHTFDKEKIDLVRKITSLKDDIKSKNDNIIKIETRVKELEQKLLKERESLILKTKENNILKISKVAQEEFKEQGIKIQTLEKELIEKNKEIRALIAQLDLKNSRLSQVKDESGSVNMEKLRLENEVNNLKTKNITDNDVIEALVNENNTYKDQIFSLSDKIKEMGLVIKNHAKFEGDKDITLLQETIKNKDKKIKEFTDEKHQRENEMREFTLDTIEKLSALKRYETQLSESSREVLQKNNLIESLNSRIDSKEKLVNALLKELNELKEKKEDSNFEIINEIMRDI